MRLPCNARKDHMFGMYKIVLAKHVPVKEHGHMFHTWERRQALRGVQTAQRCIESHRSDPYAASTCDNKDGTSATHRNRCGALSKGPSG